MSRLSIQVGVVLIALGAGSYYATGMQSVTALIPSFFGAAFAVLGLIGVRSESMRKHVMHATMLLALLGAGGSFSGLISFFRMLGGFEPERPYAVYAQAFMCVICLYIVTKGIQSFIAARRSKED